MKKWLSILFATVFLFGGTIFAHAESMSYTDLVLKWQAKLGTIETVRVAVEGELAVTNPEAPDFRAKLSGDTVLDIVNLNTQGKLNLGLVYNNMQQWAPEWVLNGERLFYKWQDDDGWQETEVAQHKSSLRSAWQAFNKELERDEEWLLTMAPLLNDLFEVTETDTTYVVTLKQNIDGRAFYQKHQETINRVKSLAIHRMEEGGRTPSDNEIMLFDTYINEANFAQLFKQQYRLTTIYDKATYQLKDVAFEVAIDANEMNVSQKIVSVGEKIMLKYHIVLDHYNEPVQFTNPEVE